MKADATGLIDTTYLDAGTAVPGTAVFNAGFAYTPDGSLYICPLPGSTSDYVFIRGMAVRNDGAVCVATSPTVAGYSAGVALSADGEVAVAAAVDGNFLAGLGITVSGEWPVSDPGGGGGGGGSYILLEDGSQILLETSGSLLLE